MANDQGRTADGATPGMTLNLDQSSEAIHDEIKRVASTIGSDQQLNDLARSEFQRRENELPRITSEEARDHTREIITLWLIGVFCAVVILSFVALFIMGIKQGFDEKFFMHFKDLLAILLGPVVALLSSAIGFYFGYEKGAATAHAGKASGTATGSTRRTIE